MKQKLKILMLFDLPYDPPKDQDYSSDLNTDEWLTEKNILKSLQKLGHDVKMFGIYNDIGPLYTELKENTPDIVFNLIESFNHNRDLEPHVASFLELMGVPFTGADAAALRLCKDKGLTKKILDYHNIRIPKFEVSKRSRPIKNLKDFTYPAIIKPLQLEASEGISQLSFADNENSALERITFIHDSLKVDAIVEEFIEGREIYVGVLGTKRPKILPPRELFFSQVPDNEPKFATFKAKWDKKYRKKWGITTRPAKTLTDEVLKKLEEYCREIYRHFRLRGYARIDFRVKEDGEVVFLEANPNPGIASDEDFTRSAEKAGLNYEELMTEIMKHALVKEEK